ncbi:MAG: TatD family hydrolase [Candidatus Magasanikbacteria bacterium]
MIDSHCHIQFNAYKDDYEQVIATCRAKGVVLNAVGSQIDTSRRAVEFAEKYDDIYATIGLHPVHLSSTEVSEDEIQFKSREEKFDYAEYKKLAQHPKVIGIGECGLELFHLPKDANKEEIIKTQTEGFLEQYKLAQEFDLPLVIHVRDAHTEMINLLKTLPTPTKGVVHCFTGNWQQAQEYLNLGLYLGFTGVITFPPKKTDPQPQIDLIEVAKKAPLDRILIETDAPYLAPQAYRGKRCEPWMVIEVAKQLAIFRNKELAEIDEITTANAKKLFRIK